MEKFLEIVAGHDGEITSNILSVFPIPILVANIDGSVKATKQDVITSLSEQVSHPVQWVKTQDFFLKNGVTDIVECGPGRTLTGLAKRTLKGITLFNASNAQSIESIAAQFSTE